MYSFIGSYAARYHIPSWREPRDIDVLTDDPNLKKEDVDCGGLKVEIHYTEKFAGFNRILIEGRYPSLSALLTLKMSHLQFGGRQWIKHAKDVIALMNLGVPYYGDIYFSLLNFWQERFKKRKGTLKKTNDDFFKDNVKRKYVHDDLHLAVAYYGEPLYNRIKYDRSLATCSQYLFHRLSHDDQLKLCREEIYATALERFLIPSEFKTKPIVGYRQALQNLIVSMTSGFFCNFLIFNLNNLVNPDKDFQADFINALQNNEVREVDSATSVSYNCS